MPDSVIDFAKQLLAAEQRKSTIALLYVCVAASIWKQALCFPASEIENLNTLGFLCGTHRMLSAFVLFGVVPAGIVKFAFKEKLSDYGVCLGNWRLGVFWLCLMLPFMLLFGYGSAMSGKFVGFYPMNPFIVNGCTIPVFASHAFFFILFYIGWEFMFRGFLQQAIMPQAGPQTAILVQTLASTMLHYGNPFSEVLASILAGIFWGFLVIRTRSLFSGLIQHSVLGVTLDYFSCFGKI